MYIEVQNGNIAYCSGPIRSTADIDFYCTEVVMAMLAAAASNHPKLDMAIPDRRVQKKPLSNGIGLSDNHKQLVLMKQGEVIVLEEGPRWLIATALQLRVATALDTGKALMGEW